MKRNKPEYAIVLPNRMEFIVNPMMKTYIKDGYVRVWGPKMTELLLRLDSEGVAYSSWQIDDMRLYLNKRLEMEIKPSENPEQSAAKYLENWK